MTTPRIVYVPEKQYKKLFKVVKWYGDMPKCLYEDHFCDDVSIYIDNLLPSFPETKKGTHFSVGTRIETGQLFTTLIADVENEEDIVVQLLPKIE